MVQEVAEQNLRGCTTLIQVRKVAELDWRDFPTNLPTFVPTFVLGNIYKWLICICILIDFERIARSNYQCKASLVSTRHSAMGLTDTVRAQTSPLPRAVHILLLVCPAGRCGWPGKDERIDDD